MGLAEKLYQALDSVMVALSIHVDSGGERGISDKTFRRATRALKAYRKDRDTDPAVTRERLRAFLASDPRLGGVDVQQLAFRLHARGLRAPKVSR